MSPSKDSPPPWAQATGFAIKGFSLAPKKDSKSAEKSISDLPARRKAIDGTNGRNESGAVGKRQRGNLDIGGADSDSDDGSHRHREVKVEGWGAEGVLIQGSTGRKTKEDLVIPKQANKDWRADVRKRKRGGRLPDEVVARREIKAKGEGVDVVNSKDGDIQWGLTVTKRERDERPEEEVAESVENGDAGTRLEKNEALPKEKTDDELAMEALLGKNSEKKGPDLVIPAAVEDEDGFDGSLVTGDDAYRRAIRNAPDVSTLEDYERVPVEEFGAALLRGMGWKGDKKEGPKEVKRRQNLLGLGAKELKDAEELGAWVQKSDIKRLNGSGSRGGDRRPKASEYRREKELREERREERHGSYRSDRYRDTGHHRDRDDYRDRDRYRR